MESKRTLTDDDIAALSHAISKNMSDKFYNDLGKGVWSLLWKAILLAIISIASYGSLKGMK